MNKLHPNIHKLNVFREHIIIQIGPNKFIEVGFISAKALCFLRAFMVQQGFNLYVVALC